MQDSVIAGGSSSFSFKCLIFAVGYQKEKKTYLYSSNIFTKQVFPYSSLFFKLPIGRFKLRYHQKNTQYNWTNKRERERADMKLVSWSFLWMLYFWFFERILLPKAQINKIVATSSIMNSLSLYSLLAFLSSVIVLCSLQQTRSSFLVSRLKQQNITSEEKRWENSFSLVF